MIKGIAPGSILQHMFLRSRLRKIFAPASKFIEVGSGNGDLSNLLLKTGFTGAGVDLNASACENNQHLNKQFIEENKYKVINGDFLGVKEKDFDFLISCMVIEHIPDADLRIFMEHAKNIVKENGKLVFLVPSNMKAWGIEDEIAGHVKRYTFADINQLAESAQMKVDFRCGLNYPVSNWLLHMSNRVVRKHEAHLRDKSDLEKTVYTGNRNVKFKTTFPSYLNVVLNEIVMLPFHWMQLAAANNEKSLVMYFELSKKTPS